VLGVFGVCLGLGFSSDNKEIESLSNFKPS